MSKLQESVDNDFKAAIFSVWEQQWMRDLNIVGQVLVKGSMHKFETSSVQAKSKL